MGLKRIGQIKIEFIFSVLFFSIIVFFVGIELNRALSTVITDSELDYLKSKANSIVDILVKDQGEPEDWEKNPPLAKRIGFASTPYNLSLLKINKVDENCTLIDEKFDIKNYKLTINTTEGILSCGYGGPKIRAVVERSVYIEGEYGRVRLELW